jgi:transposase
MAHYHKRSNVETTFGMIKAKFGGFVRSKLPVAQVNEVLCKILYHNICCLIQSMCELGVEPEFFQNV